jgi:hypothetical protein
MRIAVEVSEAVLRGVPFPRYASVLHNVLGERYLPESIDITPSARTAVAVDGRGDSPAAAEVLAIMRTLTHPSVIDGFFG